MSGLIFTSLIHFEFIFVHGVRECSNFILLHVAVQFSQHHLFKRLSFLPFGGLPFHLVYDFFAVPKLLSFIRSHLFIFISISLEGGSKVILL